MDDRLGEILDTAPEVRAQYFARLARLTPAERAHAVVGLNRAVRAMARAGIRQRHPQAGPAEIEVELAEVLYGPAVARMIAPYLASSR